MATDDQQVPAATGGVSPGVSRVVGHAYPWDVIGDPAFGTRVQGLGIGEVTLAASYHSTRAATPSHPLHRVVEAPQAALYRPVREAAWTGRSLRPAFGGGGEWSTGGAEPPADPFALAAEELLAQGFDVNAWLVLAHSTRLGTLRPDLSVRNCFGDRYSYALCIAHQEVRDYLTTLAAEVARDVPITGLSIEGLGQMGFAHNGPHEKTDGAFGPAAQRILSVCCCSACQTAWSARGLDPRQVIDELRDALIAAQAGGSADAASMSDLLGSSADQVLAARHKHQDAARQQVLTALHDVAPQARVTLHGQPDQWGTGPSPAVTASAAQSIDSILVPAWAVNDDSYGAVKAARLLAPAAVSVGAYVTVLPPADLTGISAHIISLVDAGADELHFYHLGLATAQQLATLGDVVNSLKPDQPRSVE